GGCTPELFLAGRHSLYGGVGSAVRLRQGARDAPETEKKRVWKMVQTIGRSAFLRADRGKMMKKWLKWWTGLLCAAVLMLGASVTVLAAEMGSITVEGAVEGVDYSIYRIFDLESFSSEGGGTGRYAYKLSEKWNGFSAGEYFTVDENGYIDWKAGNGQEAAKGFAEAAFAFAKREKIAADAVVQASAGEGKEASAVFANIPLGYYLVDSTAGALLSLDTARPDATVKEKNEAPGIEKTVQKEDGNYGADNSASVG
ncbi:MAG: hypothetical protein ACLTQL_01465, partial [Eisenbergiella sp.]